MTDKLAELGRLLVERGVLEQFVVDEALDRPETSEAIFLSRLLGEGAASEFDLVAALAEQFGMPGVDLSQSCFLLDVLDLVPRPVAETDQILPLSSEGGRLHVAVATPAEAESTADEVRFITGMEVSLYVALTEPLRAAIAAAYDLRERDASVWQGPALGEGAEPGLCILEPQGPLVDVEPIEGELDEVVEAEPAVADDGELRLVPPPDLGAPTEDADLSLELGAPGSLIEPAHAPPGEPLIDLAPATTGTPLATTLAAKKALTPGAGTGRVSFPPAPAPIELSIEPASAPLKAAPATSPLKPAPQPGKAAAQTKPAPRPESSAPLIDIEIGDDDDEEEVLETVRVGPKRILVVDDEPDIVRLCLRALQSKGYSLDSAADGAEAEAKLHKGDGYDLVLLDAMLPHVHGFEICQRLKASAKLRATQVIMMSAVYRGWRFAQDARETYGADDYLEKPFHLADLLRRVEERLALGKAQAPAKKETERLYREGMGQLEKMQLPEARATFEKAIKEDQFSPRVHFALARVLAAMGDGYRAITSYERAVELRPNLFPALKSLAQLYLEKGFRRKAAETLERALQTAPDPQTRENLRTSLLRLL